MVNSLAVHTELDEIQVISTVADLMFEHNCSFLDAHLVIVANVCPVDSFRTVLAPEVLIDGSVFDRDFDLVDTSSFSDVGFRGTTIEVEGVIVVSSNFSFEFPINCKELIDLVLVSSFFEGLEDFSGGEAINSDDCPVRHLVFVKLVNGGVVFEEFVIGGFRCAAFHFVSYLVSDSR